MRDDMRDDVAAPSTSNRTCPICGTGFRTAGRGIYCSRACQQQAYRVRHQSPIERTAGRASARRSTEQTVYECPECGTRYLGVRRCSECNLMCRKLGLGGLCPHCDELVLLAELMDAVSPFITSA
jgi:predicted RNA-binding Zn-ribbon protein involved in translation (DUF1610 family)